MQELINIFTHTSPQKSYPYERAIFYREETDRSDRDESIERYVEVIHVILFNEHGEIIIQKRSKEKNHNPNLLDKSIWWHVQVGDSPNLTAMIESIQELQTPSIVLDNHTDFLKTYEVLKNYLTTSAIIEYIDTVDFDSEKIIWDRCVSIGNRVHLYFWVYAGRVKNVDKEAKGIFTYSLDDIEDEIQKWEQYFTRDMIYLLRNYSGKMRKFLSELWLV